MVGAHRREELVGTLGPVGGSVDGAAVAQQHPVGIEIQLDLLGALLHLEDGSLGRTLHIVVADPWETAGEQRGRRLGHHHHGVTDLAPEQVGRGGLATARPTGEHDPRYMVVLRGSHRAIVPQVRQPGRSHAALPGPPELWNHGARNNFAEERAPGGGPWLIGS